MPVGAFVPSLIHYDYPEWQTPVIGDVGKVWAYTGSGYAPVSLAFDPAGTAAAAIATHVGLSDPHTQYLLESAYTAADVLSKLLTVDGSGSGLDADLLDGQSSAYYLPAASFVPPGSDTRVLFNDGGTWGTDAGLTYAKATDRLTVAGGLVAPSMRPASDSTTALQLQNAAGTAFVIGDSTNGRVGIGVNPATPLGITSGSFTFATGGISLGDGDTGIYERESDDYLVLRAGGTDILHLVGGNVGIGGYPINELNINKSKIGGVIFTVTNTSTNAAAYSQFFMQTGNTAGPLVGLTSYSPNATGTSAGKSNAYLNLIGAYNGSLLVSTGGRADSEIIFAIESTQSMAIATTGYVAVGTHTATALLDIAASNAARASLRMRAGTAPTTPNAGDIWYATGGRLSLYRAATEIFATGVQATGGSATAGATWTSTEQDMLQKIYDAGRAFGLLS